MEQSNTVEQPKKLNTEWDWKVVKETGAYFGNVLQNNEPTAVWSWEPITEPIKVPTEVNDIKISNSEC